VATHALSHSEIGDIRFLIWFKLVFCAFMAILTAHFCPHNMSFVTEINMPWEFIHPNPRYFLIIFYIFSYFGFLIFELRIFELIWRF
jgi:hypothetical protein